MSENKPRSVFELLISYGKGGQKIFMIVVGIVLSGLCFGGNPLPVIKITTSASVSKNEVVAGMMEVYDQSIKSNELSCAIGIKYRGWSSYYWNAKKQYRLETRGQNGSNENVMLLGMPRENDWVLSASYDDKTLIRNAVAYSIGARMGHYAPRFVFCDLYVNGSYEGIYMATEVVKRDRNRVDIKANDSCCEAESYIIEVIPANRIDTSEVTFKSSRTSQILAVKYPGKPDTAQLSDITASFNSVEVFLYSDQNKRDYAGHIANLLDVRSFADYIICQELFRNIDAFFASTFFSKDHGKPLTAGPLWDFNISMGNADYHEGWKTRGVWASLQWWSSGLLSNPFFKKAYIARWRELRRGVLSEASIIGVVDSCKALVSPSVDNNFKRWPVLGVWIKPNYFIGQSHDEEVSFLKYWLLERLHWLDSLYYDSKIEVVNNNLNGSSVAVSSCCDSVREVERIKEADGSITRVRLSGADSFVDSIADLNSPYLYVLWPADSNIAPAVVKLNRGSVPPFRPAFYRLRIENDSLWGLWDDFCDNEEGFIVEYEYGNRREYDTLAPNTTRLYIDLSSGECPATTVYSFNASGLSRAIRTEYPCYLPDYEIKKEDTENYCTDQSSYAIVTATGLVIETGTVGDVFVRKWFQQRINGMKPGVYYITIACKQGAYALKIIH